VGGHITVISALVATLASAASFALQAEADSGGYKKYLNYSINTVNQK